MILLSLLLFGFVYSDVCGFEADDIVTYEAAKECIQSVKVNNGRTEILAVTNSVINYLANSAYLDNYQAIPAPFTSQSQNVTDKLKSLNSKTFNNADEFYSAVSEIIRSVGDPNLNFEKPCGENFIWSLPLGIEAFYNKADDEIQLRFSPLPSTFQQITSNVPDSDDFKALFGRQIVGISENNLDNELQQDPITYLRTWASNNVFISRSEAANFNRAVQLDFAIRQQSSRSIPPKETVTFRFINDDDTEEDREIPWFAWVQVDIPEDDLESLCPIITAENQKSNRIQTLRSARTNVMNADEAYVRHTIMKVGGKKIAYLRINTLDVQGDSLQKYVKQLTTAANTFHNQEATHFVLDLRTVLGGKPGIGLQTLRYLFGNKYPLYPEMDMKKTNFHTELQKYNLLSRSQKYAYAKNTNLTQQWYSKDVKKTVKVGSTNVESIFTNKYTVTQFFGEGTGSDAEYYHTLDGDGEALFPPENTLVLTDGICTGSCALMIKKISESKLAKILALGLPDDSIPFTIGSGVAGSMYSSDEAELLPTLFADITFKQLTAPFPRNTVYLSWPEEAVYSYDWNARNEKVAGSDLLEFRIEKPDFRLAHFPSYNEFTAKNINTTVNSLSSYITKCVSWNVQKSTNCTKGSDKKSPLYSVTNGIYGHPCAENGLSFDTTKCSFMECKKGYFLNAKNKCEVIPALSPASGSVWKVLGPVLILAVVLVALIAVFLLSRRWKQKKEKTPRNLSEDYQKINDEDEDGDETSLMDHADEVQTD